MTATTTTPLQQEIDAFNARGKDLIPAEIRQNLCSPVVQLTQFGAASRALKEGAPAPDFTLPDARGEAVTLSNVLKEGPAIITFYRGEWCPYCNIELRAYQAVRATYLQVGANVPAYNGDESWELPMTGTFVVDQAGIVRLAFVDPDFTRRLDPSLAIARLHAGNITARH